MENTKRLVALAERAEALEARKLAALERIADALDARTPWRTPNAESTALLERVKTLEAELAETRRAADATAVYLERFDADTATLELKSDAFRLLAELAYSYGEACGMENYVEAMVKVGPLQAKDGKREFVVTLQRLDGKTPHELRAEAERERDALREQVKMLEALILGSQRVDAEMDGSSVTFHAARAGGYAIVPLSPDGSGLADASGGEA